MENLQGLSWFKLVNFYFGGKSIFSNISFRIVIDSFNLCPVRNGKSKTFVLHERKYSIQREGFKTSENKTVTQLLRYHCKKQINRDRIINFCRIDQAM